MTFTIHEASIPVLRRGLSNLSAILAKAEASAAARKIDLSVLVNARLAPDMHPLARQIQIASDTAKGGAARLAGVEAPPYPDVEATFAELQERIAKTIAYLDSFKPEQFEGAEDRAVVLKTPRGELNFTGRSFLLGFALPNFFFHIVTAYDILRHNGADLGKLDYLGGI